MQSRHRVFAEDQLLAQLQGEDDHFDNVPDSLVLIIFNKLADARSLGRCSAVSKRFNALVPLVDDACLRIDRVISTDAAADALGVSGGSTRQRGIVFSGLLKTMLLAVLKPFGHCDAGVRSAAHGQGKHAPHHSPAQVLKNFSSISNRARRLAEPEGREHTGVLLHQRRPQAACGLDHQLPHRRRHQALPPDDDGGPGLDDGDDEGPEQRPVESVGAGEEALEWHGGAPSPEPKSAV